MSLNDDSYEDSQEEQLEQVYLCTKGNSCVSAATFGLGN